MPRAVLIMPKGSEGSVGFDLDLVCICASKSLRVQTDRRTKTEARVYNAHKVEPLQTLVQNFDFRSKANNYLLKCDECLK